MESGGSVYSDMDRMVAMETAVKTWGRWVDSYIDTTKTRVFFQSFSPTHYKYAPSFTQLTLINVSSWDVWIYVFIPISCDVGSLYYHVLFRFIFLDLSVYCRSI